MNDYWNRMNTMPPYLAPHYEIIKVNGEAGAKAFHMAPNSNTLLLDETQPIVWLVQTDGAGYLTTTPYDITPHQNAPEINLNNLEQRVAQLEATINAKQSYFRTNKSKKQQQQLSTNESAIDSES